MKKFKVYLANGETLTIKANRFQSSGSEIIFYDDNNQPLGDILINSNQVAAIISNKEERKNSSAEVPPENV